MNLNAERHFSQVPDTFVEHSTFDRSRTWTSTINAGVLNCFYWDEAIPGDIYNISTSHLTRMTTVLFPVNDSCFLDVYYFFVPWRLTFNKTKEFFGENTSTAWTPSTTYNLPTINTMLFVTRTPGDLAHQMGVPLRLSAGGFNICALPFRSIRLIWNEYFRDQNTESPELLNTGTTETDATLNKLYPVCRVHDLFGSLLPKPQKNNDTVQIGIDGIIPVETRSSVWGTGIDQVNPVLINKVGTNFADTSLANLGKDTTGKLTNVTGLSGTLAAGSNKYYFGNLQANASLSQSSLAMDVNTLRESVQMQKVFEAMARFGSRYTEILKGLYGVISDDARLQRPELLGAERWYINMQDNVQTSAGSSTSTPLSTVSGWSKTVGQGAKFSYSVREHGYVIGVCCIRHNRSYSQGLHKAWFRTGMFSVYNPKLAHIGEQPVLKRELYAAGASPTGILGYQEAWYEYRYSGGDINAGLMDPGATVDSGTGDPTALGAYWTYGDWYKSEPTLSASFMHEGDEAVQRTLAVQNEDQFICQIHVDNQHVRPMPMYSIPGLVDHF